MEQRNKNRLNLKLVLTVLTMLIPFMSIAQENYAENSEMAQVLYQNGKIYLVVFVLATIFVGIILYLVLIERKLNKLEKNNK